jgi:transposase InsO family protein
LTNRRASGAAGITSEQFQRLIADNGVDCSMSRSGNVWNNAAMESFFSSLKAERIGPKGLPDAGRRQSRRVRLHREILQHDPQTLDQRPPQRG